MLKLKKGLGALAAALGLMAAPAVVEAPVRAPLEAPAPAHPAQKNDARHSRYEAPKRIHRRRRKILGLKMRAAFGPNPPKNRWWRRALVKAYAAGRGQAALGNGAGHRVYVRNVYDATGKLVGAVQSTRRAVERSAKARWFEAERARRVAA